MLDVGVMFEDRRNGATELFASRLSLRDEEAGVLSYLGWEGRNCDEHKF